MKNEKDKNINLFESVEYTSTNNIQEVFNYINLGIFQIETFINGKTIKQILYNLEDAFKNLFSEMVKPQNLNTNNISLVHKYWDIFETLRIRIEDGDYDDSIEPVNGNGFICKVERTVSKVQDLILVYFEENNLIPDEESHKHSVLDIMLKSKKENYIPKVYKNKSSNMLSDFHPSLFHFLKMANITHKYKTDFSCYGFYYDLKYSFRELEADILNLYTTIPQSDKAYFIDAYIKKIKIVSDNYIAGDDSLALNYLKENNCSIVDLFENQLPSVPMHIQPKSFPAYLKRTYFELQELGLEWNDLDLHHSFMFHISDYYIDYIIYFFKNLII